MKHTQIQSIVITGILLLSTLGLLTIPVMANPGIHALKGMLYIDDQIAPNGVEIQLIFSDVIFNNLTVHDEQFELNYNIGFNGHDGETGDIRVQYQGKTKIPTDNATIYVTGDIGLFYDFHIYSGIQNIPPTADANGPYTGAKDIPRTLDGSGSFDSDGTIILYEWDFNGDSIYEFNSTSPMTSHTYTAAGIYTTYLQVTDNDGATDIDSTQVTILAQDTTPPSKVTGLTVTNKKNGKLQLTWNAATDNVEIDTYRIYRDGTFIISSISLTYLDTGLTNGQTYTYQVSAVDTSTNEGEKSDNASGTPTKSSSGSTGGGGFFLSGIPIADASNGEPYTGSVGEPILFDGTLSNDTDGTILSWEWDFGNDVTGSGETISYTYDQPGIYTVILTVIDNDGQSDTDETTATIIRPNRPPSIPTITGPPNGSKTIDYDFSIVSTDPDGDDLQYTVDWDDGQSDQSTFLPNGTTYTMAHAWTKAGVYSISVDVSDNQTSSQNQQIILIDSLFIKDIGHLMDTNGDGTYDTFYSNTTGEETDSLSDDDKGSYLIDEDGDGAWDWRYYLETGELLEYEGEPASEDIDWSLWILLIILIIVILVFAALVIRNNNKKKAKIAAEKKAAAAKKTETSKSSTKKSGGAKKK